MRDLPFRRSAPVPSAGHDLARRQNYTAQNYTTIEPVLPVLLRSVAFFCALAAPFVAALLFR